MTEGTLLSERPAATRVAAPARAGQEPAAGLVLCLQAALLSRATLEDAASAFAAELARALDCERVGVGLAGRHGVEPLATSDAGMLDGAGAAARALALAMNEACDQHSTLIHPAPPGARPQVRAAHQRLLGGGIAGVATVPLPARDGIAGALIIERRASGFADWEIALLEDAASFAGPLLDLKRRAQRGWHARLAESLGTHLGTLRGRHAARNRLVLAVLACAAIAASLIPLPYRVGAPARLEGRQQRAIVAPADGYLRQAGVRAGDRVRAGQVLAELAGEDLALERNRRESELRQHENAYRTALARSDRAQMVVHQARAGEAEAMLALVDAQIERARITAPFDGVVIKGDLAQQLGAPVARGDVLLTLAPGDGFRLIIEVDEADIGAVRVGQPGRLVLAAGPERAWDFRVERIVPMATAADGRNYFEVEAVPTNAAPDLRPGLRGIARIEAGERGMWWLATHRALAWLRLRLWSFTGWAP